MSESKTAWRARALLDARALRHNLDQARRLAPGRRVMAVVKCNAYGHGLAQVAGALARHVDAFAVATLQEGVDCRQAAPESPVTILSGLLRPEDLAVCARARLHPVLHCEEHLQWVERRRGQVKSLNPWLKIDTGMNRLGIAPARVADAVARLQRVGVNIRLMSHLASADDASDGFTDAQLRRFKRATDAFDVERSLANSAAVMRLPATHCDWVRPGVMLYGGSPLLGIHGPALDLQPVMQLQARLIAVKTVRKNDAIGYGLDFTAPKSMRIGIVGFGYGDGYPRTVDRGGDASAPAVLINGNRAPLVGRVSMDMLTVDVSKIEARIGDEVTLWGDGLSVDEVAAWAGTIAYELLCKISERVERVPRTSVRTSARRAT